MAIWRFQHAGLGFDGIGCACQGIAKQRTWHSGGVFVVSVAADVFTYPSVDVVFVQELCDSDRTRTGE